MMMTKMSSTTVRINLRYIVSDAQMTDMQQIDNIAPSQRARLQHQSMRRVG